MRDLGDRTEKTGKSFRGLKIAGAAALLAVGTAAVKFGSQSVKAYVEAEGSQIRLQDAFRKFPKLADTNVGSLNKLNTALALKTKFDDDATASGQAVLAQFNLTGKQITSLTPLLQDYAAKTGKDLPTAARDLGKAMMGQGRSLKSVGIDFKDTGTQAGNLDQITKGLRTQVGGFAEKEGKSAAGQSAILKNQFGELQEAAGKQLLPALLKVGGGLLKLVGWVQDNSALFKAFGRISAAVFGSFAESVGVGKGAFKNFGDYIETHQADIITGFTKVGKGALAIGDGILVAASVGLRGFAVIMDAQKNSTAGFLAGFGQIIRGAALAFGWIPDIGPKLKASEVSFAMFSRGALIGMDKAAAGARNAADGIDGKLRPALDKAGRKLDEVSRKEIIKAAARDAVKRAAIAIRDLGTDADGSQIKLKKWSDVSKLGADRQKALRDRITDARRGLREQLGAMADAGVGQTKLSRAWEIGKKRLYEEFRQMGLSKEEARKLAVRYAGIKPKVETKVTQPGMKGKGGAIDSAETLADRHQKIKSRSVAIKVTYSASGKVAVGSIKDRKLAGLGAKSGGVLPGWSPGRDVHHFTSPTAGDLDLSGGEGVLIPQATKAIGGPSGIKRINDAARKGQPYTQAFRDGGVFRTIKIHGETNTPPDISGAHSAVTRRVNRYAGRIAEARAEEIGKALAAYQRKKIKSAKADAAGSGSGPSIAAGPGWGPVMAAMRKHGARNFNTYPGHHPSMAMARDVTPHNWGAANAAKALSSVWYVIYRMRIASKNHGNGWRPYRPTNFNGDWQHVRHIHVARRDKGGLLRQGQLAQNYAGGVERVLTQRQNDNFERLVRVMDHSGGRGGNVTVIVNAPNLIGSPKTFVDALVPALTTLNRQGRLTGIKTR